MYVPLSSSGSGAEVENGADGGGVFIGSGCECPKPKVSVGVGVVACFTVPKRPPNILLGLDTEGAAAALLASCCALKAACLAFLSACLFAYRSALVRPSAPTTSLPTAIIYPSHSLWLSQKSAWPLSPTYP